jgi:transcriptional antiterminator NusG
MNRSPKLIFKVGDRIRIKAGPFAAFTGNIEGINQSKALLKVKVEIFGRITPVKISFSEAEKLEFLSPFSPPLNQN